MSNPYDTVSERTSVLGPTLRFKGELSADEDLVVHGSVEGTIGPSPRVTIGPEAKVTADVHAGIVVVEGALTGNVRADTACVVRPTAVLSGDIHAPAVSILEGASFNGSVAMGANARAASRPAADAAPARPANRAAGA